MVYEAATLDLAGAVRDGRRGFVHFADDPEVNREDTVHRRQATHGHDEQHHTVVVYIPIDSVAGHAPPHAGASHGQQATGELQTRARVAPTDPCVAPTHPRHAGSAPRTSGGAMRHSATRGPRLGGHMHALLVPPFLPLLAAGVGGWYPPKGVCVRRGVCPPPRLCCHDLHMAAHRTRCHHTRLCRAWRRTTRQHQ